jgi:hypothetical protein
MYNVHDLIISIEFKMSRPECSRHYNAKKMNDWDIFVLFGCTCTTNDTVVLF